MEYQHYIPAVHDPGNKDSVSARRIKIFFGLDPSSLSTSEELKHAQESLQHLGTAAIQLALDLPPDYDSSLAQQLGPVTDWLRGEQTRLVSGTLGIKFDDFDRVRKSAMEVLGTPAVFEAIFNDKEGSL